MVKQNKLKRDAAASYADADTSFAGPPSTTARTAAAKAIFPAALDNKMMKAHVMQAAAPFFTYAHDAATHHALQGGFDNLATLAMLHSVGRVFVTVVALPVDAASKAMKGKNTEASVPLYAKLGLYIAVLKEGITTADISPETYMPTDDQVLYSLFSPDGNVEMVSPTWLVPRDTSLQPMLDTSGKGGMYAAATMMQLSVELKTYPLKAPEKTDTAMSSEVDMITASAMTFYTQTQLAFCTANDKIISAFIGDESYGDLFGDEKLATLGQQVLAIADVPNDVPAVPEEGTDAVDSEAIAAEKMEEEVEKTLLAKVKELVKPLSLEESTPQELKILTMYAGVPAPWPRPKSWKTAPPMRKSAKKVAKLLSVLSINPGDTPFFYRLLDFCCRMPADAGRDSFAALAAAIRFCRAWKAYEKALSGGIVPICKSKTDKQKTRYTALCEWTQQQLLKRKESDPTFRMSLLNVLSIVNPTMPTFKTRCPIVKKANDKVKVDFTRIGDAELLAALRPMWRIDPAREAKLKEDKKVDRRGEYYDKELGPACVKRMHEKRAAMRDEKISFMVPQPLLVNSLTSDNKSVPLTSASTILPAGWGIMMPLSQSPYISDMGRGMKTKVPSVTISKRTVNIMTVPWAIYKSREIMPRDGLSTVDTDISTADLDSFEDRVEMARQLRLGNLPAPVARGNDDSDGPAGAGTGQTFTGVYEEDEALRSAKRRAVGAFSVGSIVHDDEHDGGASTHDSII
jgi:hypothetical protein